MQLLAGQQPVRARLLSAQCELRAVVLRAYPELQPVAEELTAGRRASTGTGTNGARRVGAGPYAVSLRAVPSQYLPALEAAVGVAPPPSREPGLAFSLRRLRDGCFELRHPAGRKRTDDPWGVSALVQGVLLRALTLWARTHVALHAACMVAPAGGAVLLPAASGTGKSTAALALAAEGWRCCSDDLTFWDPATGLASGTDLAVALKRAAPPVLARRLAGWRHHAVRFRDTAGRFASRQAYLAPATSLPWRARLRAIGFLARGPGRPRIRTLTAGEALARLWPLRVRDTFDGGDRRPQPAMAAVARGLRGVALAEIRTGRVADVVPTIRRWLGPEGPTA